ncbi:hypothetical protein M409DRAFT_50739 [Zasmidium cellare ATCC 36951]|uniref:14-3-3 domain-containing protein n=1 Tax=Zasmidium cellare ATCC 36951 TaxID=1080233 RepID=A0A6A6CVW1_ZASCE|nr:uncharacterized protein M409DRAFT_50739 [Zasmidium cellare ATCC 36951]KAF2171274.1 hypothetical protein M409DRAFT_50739 [Zasmidium cellare ATCC 36951]
MASSSRYPPALPAAGRTRRRCCCAARRRTLESLCCYCPTRPGLSAFGISRPLIVPLAAHNHGTLQSPPPQSPCPAYSPQTLRRRRRRRGFGLPTTALLGIGPHHSSTGVASWGAKAGLRVSPIEEKILGRLAKQTAPFNALLSASLYQVLGLSILLSRKLYRARKLRKLDITRDTKSLQLYHHIIWLAREGLSITEVYILPYCQNGERGPECRVMAAKLRASLYHVFCLFHNHPPISQLSGRSYDSTSPLSSAQSPQATQGTKSSPKRSPPNSGRHARQRSGNTALRDPIPSMTSEASYVTNPYAAAQSPPPPGLAISGAPADARRTPTRPPGLAPINISPTQSAASFLLPPLNFVPMAREHFDGAQHLANTLLAPTHALRLSISLEHAAFLWDCAKEHDRARKLARRTIKDVYSSSDGLDDDEFADASALVQALGGIVRRGSNDSTPRPSTSTLPRQQQQQQQALTTTPNQRLPRQNPNPPPPIDRTIALSPKNRAPSSSPNAPPTTHNIPRTIPRTPERLSTVPEVESTEEEGATATGTTNTQPTTTGLSPPVSRLSSRSSATSAAAGSEKAAKRRAVERAEERAAAAGGSSSRVSQRSGLSGGGRSSQRSGGSRRERRREASRKMEEGEEGEEGDGGGGGEGGSSSQPHSRQATPPEGYVRRES